MRNRMCLFLFLVVMECYLATARGTVVQQKSDDAIPVTTMSPPEGNTTFIDGTTWCVARPGASQSDLQNALDWACGNGQANCQPIQQGEPCFEPDTLLSHASYAFNSYYQANGNSDVACNFGGTAVLIKNDPSYRNCVYSTSGSLVAYAAPLLKKHSQSLVWLKLVVMLLVSNFLM